MDTLAAAHETSVYINLKLLKTLPLERDSF